MKVILRENLDGVGKKGDVLEVSDGYGMNYLLPKGYAFRATAGAERQAEEMRRSRDIVDAADKAEAESMATRIVGQVITIAANAGDGGKLFGSVTTTDIVAAIEAMFNVVLDRKDLELAEPIKEIGTHTATANPHPDVVFPVTVEVIAD